MSINVMQVGSKVIEENKFKIIRPEGLESRYDFIHFISEVRLTIDGVPTVYPPGTCILYEPRHIQDYESTGSWLNHDWVEFECDDHSLVEDLKIPLNTPFYTKISRTISLKVRDLKEISRNDTMFTAPDMRIALYDLLVTISKHIHTNTTSISRKTKKEIRNVYEQIRLEIFQSGGIGTIKSIAKKHGYSVSNFCSNYRNIFKITAHQDLTAAKLLYVKQELEKNNKTEEIVRHLGFSSVEYLYMWFKKQTNMTVSQYRKSLK